MKKVSIILSAIENNDHTFHYPENGISTNDMLINKFLNRITELILQTKADVIQKEKYFELILDSISTGVIVLDEHEFVYQTNKAALQLLGLNVLCNLKQLNYVSPTLEEEIRALRIGEKYQISVSNEQGTINLSVRVAEMELKTKPVRIIVLNDIKNEMEEKEIDSWIRLIRVLTHEIMNSITPITSLSETLLAQYGTVNNDLQIGLDVINRTGSNLIRFVDSYRKFTHLPKPEPTLFYVNKFIERMIELARHQSTDTTRITFISKVRPNNLILYADENLISQVMQNLLKNAVEAICSTQEHGTIEIVATANAKEEISISVINDGPLISKEEFDHIFVPFYTTKEQGSGIGLALSRQIMRISGGSLNLQTSETQHKTAFILKFS